MGWFYPLFIGLLFLGLNSASDASDKPIGCNGYIRSALGTLEYEKIEIKLFTKQGSLKMKTECAPNSGYYFMPMDYLKKGDYVLKVHCPEGWSFEPDQYEIHFDGKTDNCSKEVDLNFDFKGFSIYGSVVTAGPYTEGPSNVKVTLSGPHGLHLETVTESKGTFAFQRVTPGKYVVKASGDLLFENDQHSFEITNTNIKLEDKIRVSGYVVTGHVFSDSQPVEGVYLVMYGEPGSKIPTNCLTNQVPDLNINEDSSNGKLLCLRVSDAKGQFQFKGVSPGPYKIVPVYRGKNVKTSYDVVPEKLDVEVKHESLLLKTNFQVEGFTVHGKINRDIEANVFVDGKLKAVSKNGQFTIPRMKPGKYTFDIQSEKFQFTPVKLEVSASHPFLPDFEPSRFLVCGVIKGNDLSTIKQSLTLKIQSAAGGDGDKSVIREEAILDTNNVCVFLPAGNYNAWIGSLANNKYFTPSKYNFQVPNNNKVAFQFSEFLGLIAGTLQCTLGCQDPLTVYLESNNKRIKEQSLTAATPSPTSTRKQLKFLFDNVESGTYRISLGDNKYCWESQGLQKEIILKDSNIENISIVQNGFQLKVTSSHDTKLNVLLKGQTVEKELNLKARVEENICLKSADPYVLKPPTTCHIFEKDAYSIQPGVNTEVQLQAVKHLVSGKISSAEKIQDLQVKVNGELLDASKAIVETKNSRGELEYEVKFGQSPNTIVTINFLSVGFSFQPAEVEKQIGDECKLDLFQVIARKAHIIKGKFVPALEGVQVRIDLLGAESGESTTVTSNEKGEYIAGPFIHSNGFKVTPSLPGYTFKEMGNDKFSFTVFQLAKIQVKVEENPGEPLTNVLLSLSGPNAYRQNRYTNGNGEMTFTDLQPGQYYLKSLLKEFRFEPSAVNINLAEQETKTISIKATRESFSLYGQLFALNGELVPNLLISAKGVGDCKEYGEEGVSDDVGNFRIWALKSSCSYVISLGGGEVGNKVERTIPTSLEVKIEQQDIKNVSFLLIKPVARMDVSMRCHTNKDKFLDSLKVIVHSTRSPDIPLHRVSFQGSPLLILPPFSIDGSELTITFESSLNEFQYKYKLPNPITIIANESFAHFDVDFVVHTAPVEQDIGRSSYFAMFCVFVVIFACMYFDKISKFVRVYVENFTSNSSSAFSKKSKVKTK